MAGMANADILGKPRLLLRCHGPNPFRGDSGYRFGASEEFRRLPGGGGPTAPVSSLKLTARAMTAGPRAQPYSCHVPGLPARRHPTPALYRPHLLQQPRQSSTSYPVPMETKGGGLATDWFPLEQPAFLEPCP